jgi:hypothetical protein
MTQFLSDNNNKPFSKSSITSLCEKGIFDPVALLDRYMGRYDKKYGPGFTRGSMLDDYLLSPEVFNSKYIEYNGALPSSGQQIHFIEELKKGSEEDLQDEDFIYSCYKKMYKTKSKQAAVDLYKKYEDLLKFTKNNPGKVPVSKWDFINTYKKADALMDHPKAKFYFGNLDPERYEVIDQMKLQANLMELPMIGYADRIIIDKEKKIVYVIDLKTVYSADKFAEQYLEYGYYLQLAIYIDMFKAMGVVDNDEYTFEGLFVCVENEGRKRAFIPKEPSQKEFIELGRSGGTVFYRQGSRIVIGYKQILDEILYQINEGNWLYTEEEMLPTGSISLGMYIEGTH